MFIVLITRGYPSKNHLQNGNFEATQAHALAKLGHKVIIIGVNCYSIKNYDILGSHHKIENGIEIFENYSLAIPSHTTMPFKWKSKIISWNIKKILNRIIKKYGKPDIIHSHYLLMTSAISQIINKYSIPLVCTEHWSKINSDNLNKDIIETGKLAYENVDKILAVSKKTATSILYKFNKKAEIIYNMVQDHYFKIDNNITLNEEFSFIAIGTMNNNRKGFDILLMAFAKFITSGNSAKLYIVGKGPLKKEYEELTIKLDIKDYVVFLSEMTPIELSTCISHCHVVVVSSRIETFGVVLIEGMAKGKPVIATRCGGPEDFITPEMGILVQPENVDELCNAMLEMKKNYDSYDQNRIRNLCYNNYSQECIANKLINIYNSVLHP